jgi:uncharacterized RDD family membrane protein YckC
MPVTEQKSDERDSSMASDIYSIGWWIESADDEIYGPASRATVARYLVERVISPNTLVRHCTEMTKRPAIDVPGTRESIPAGTSFLLHGDMLSEAWPRRNKERLALAQDSLPCVWKDQPAVLVCLRCGAPYCEKYRAKPYRRQFYFCSRCQAALYNRRAVACVFDFFLSLILFVVLPLVTLAVLREFYLVVIRDETFGALYYGFLILNWLVFAFRDRFFGKAGPGKRMLRLQVVGTADGSTPLSYGQAFVRWLALFIPVFGLIDLSVAFRDPLMRRYGDSWAGTRVIDTEEKLHDVRRSILDRLSRRKGIQLANPIETPMSTFARAV